MTDKMREEFEKKFPNHAEFIFEDGSYMIPIGKADSSLSIHCLEYRAAWRAWQAARTVPEGYVMVPVELLDRFPELNEFNYSHDDVCELNAWGVELVLSAAPEGKK